MVVLGAGDSLKVFRMEMSLIIKIRSRSRESVQMTMCVVWRMENMCALDIVDSHESCCLNEQG